MNLWTASLRVMRWELLFADLEARYEAELRGEDGPDQGSRVRAETGRVRLADRLRGAVGHPLVLSCRGVGDVTGRLVDLGPDWLLVVDEHGRELLVGTGAVRAVAGLGRETSAGMDAGGGGAVARAWDLRRSVRALARDRSALRCLLDDGTVFTGTVDRVGADFLELAEHPLDEPRRHGAVRQVRAVALSAVAVLARVGHERG